MTMIVKLPMVLMTIRMMKGFFMVQMVIMMMAIDIMIIGIILFGHYLRKLQIWYVISC